MIKPRLFLLIFLSGCGDQAETESGISENKAYCMLSKSSDLGQVQTCDFYPNLSEEQKETAKDVCQQQSVFGTWVEGDDCPQIGRLGSCTYRSSGLTTIRWEYSPTLLESAIHNCTTVDPKGYWSSAKI